MWGRVQGTAQRLNRGVAADGPTDRVYCFRSSVGLIQRDPAQRPAAKREHAKSRERPSGARLLTKTPCAERDHRCPHRGSATIMENDHGVVERDPDCHCRNGDDVSLAALLGLRAGELAALQVRDVDLTLGVVTIRRAISASELQPPKSRRSWRCHADWHSLAVGGHTGCGVVFSSMALQKGTQPVGRHLCHPGQEKVLGDHPRRTPGADPGVGGGGAVDPSAAPHVSAAARDPTASSTKSRRRGDLRRPRPGRPGRSP